MVREAHGRTRAKRAHGPAGEARTRTRAKRADARSALTDRHTTIHNDHLLLFLRAVTYNHDVLVKWAAAMRVLACFTLRFSTSPVPMARCLKERKAMEARIAEHHK